MKRSKKESIRAACSTLAEFCAEALIIALDPTDRQPTAPEQSKAEELHREIQETILSNAEEWKGTATELLKALPSKNGLPLAGGAVWIGRRLTELAKEHSACYRLNRSSRGRLWIIRRPAA